MGITGEITSLRPSERARVTAIVAEEAKGKVKTVSGVSAEGSLEAIDYAIAAKEADGDAIFADARRITGCVLVARVKRRLAFFRMLLKEQTYPSSCTNIPPGRRQAIASQKCWN